MRKRRTNTENIKIGKERIKILFGLAEKEFRRNPERAHRYIALARKIAMRLNIKIPTAYKRRYCRRCYRYLVPGVNCTVRTRASQQAVIIKCLECNNIQRYPYRREK